MKKILKVTLLTFLLISLLSLVAFADDGAAAAEGKNVFEEIWELALRNSDTVLSALAFIASTLLALTYRRGMLPILRGGLNSVNTAVTKLRESAERASESSALAFDTAKEELQAAERSLTELRERLDSFEKELSSLAKEKDILRDMKCAMETETELLYEIFMSSSIPVYQKEAVGERISEMKKKLGSQEAERDE